MPAYIHHHEVETVAVICPSCIGLLPMYVRDVEPHWSMAKIDFVYECSDCGAEVRQTMIKPEQQDSSDHHSGGHSVRRHPN
jgi:C4-type Zn-finger protein